LIAKRVVAVSMAIRYADEQIDAATQRLAEIDRELAKGSQITIEAENDKNPVIALREIEAAWGLDALHQLRNRRFIDCAPLANDDYLVDRHDYCAVVLYSDLRR
jgi:hypothetical protein